MNESDKNIVTFRTETPSSVELWRSMLERIKAVDVWDVEVGYETDTIFWVNPKGDDDNRLELTLNTSTGIAEIQREFRQDGLIPKSLTGVKYPSIRWSACYVSFIVSMEFNKPEHASDIISLLHAYFGE